jgi:hypothetical protein
LTNFAKKSLPLYCRGFKSLLSIFFCFDFFYIDPTNDFCFCKFFAKGLNSEGERLKVKFWSSEMVKIGRSQHNYRTLSPLPLPSEFSSDENNSVIRSAMDALRNSNKISLLAVAVLF